MNRINHFFILLLLFYFPLFSHYQWIVNHKDISTDEIRVKFVIGCGHSFPESELLLKRDMITDVRVRSGTLARSLDIEENGKFWEGSVKTSGNDPFVIEYLLKKRVSKTPFFQGRVVIYFQNDRGDDLKIFTGKGMEIIPADLHLKKRSDVVSFKTLCDGKPVQAKLVVIPEGKKPVYLNPGSDNYCSIKLKYSGRYLVSTFYKGKGASITFNIIE